MARVVGVSRTRSRALDAWEVASFAPGEIDHPRQLDAGGPVWLPGCAPGTVATALRDAGEWALGTPRSFDATDWWYRCRFDGAPPAAGSATVLTLGGLATVADVWLNGTHLLRSDSMFHRHALDVSGTVRSGTNDLAIRFSSLATLLEAKRPRPRWRTALVDSQQLRWFRTTLLGRMPGWSPPVQPVGPWRAVVLETREGISVEDADLRTRVEGADGVVRIALRVRLLGARAAAAATLRVGDAQTALVWREVGDGVFSLQGELRLPDVALWWPRSHGGQPLHAASVALRAGGVEHVVDLGRLGFRTIEADTGDGGFALRVNGVPVFCRGACWTPLDVVSLSTPAAAYAGALDAAAHAGMNMLRVIGTMQYEDDAFYAACDERGLLVWQDFMFANLDYPVADAAFRASVGREASELVSRVQACPCLAVLCGNSEVSQQAAMLGLPREQWSNDLFDRMLPAITGDLRPDVPYWPSTPGGGPLPFHVGTGVCHYYGVGAYRRPLEDARRAGVRFTAECLGFSHVPAQSTVDLVLSDGQSAFHHPAWKARVPRDCGAGWDFEDVRDHYLALLFGVDPPTVRREDMARYLSLSRVVTGEVLAGVLSEWRRGGSTCRGALLWLLRDLWPGAGWGLVDSTGSPKAAYYFVRRVMQPVALVMTDEGLDGLALHAVNDTAAPIEADVELTLYRHGDLRVASAVAPVTIAPRSTLTVGSDALLERFLDVTYAYRFGPPERDVVVGALRGRDGSPLGQAFHFPLGHGFARERDLGLEAHADPAGDGGVHVLTVRTKRFAQAVALDVPGYVPDDDYVHLEPGGQRQITLRPVGPARPLRGSVQPLNAFASTKIVVGGPEGPP
ncbi:MAG TPA: hypothetical protein VIF15_03435 [Polyangiaceae bacterium]